ncbi:MAG: efflux RND transporter periplasmic adaptor subunit [Nonlabens sp.]|uniref:efflux RND transporter periplasmic adaptor subunit n=1 Tax=Nonlabens sp. TaxID=1888209 RepID=UPI00321B8FBC
MQRIINIIAVTSLLLTLISCGNQATEQEASQAIDDDHEEEFIFVSNAQFESSKMTLGSMEEKPFPITVKTTGMIDVPPENRAVVNATMGGYIKTTPLLIGDEVSKGQVLVTIENPQFVQVQQEYMEVKEQLNYLQVEFERHETMRKENITSQKSFLQAQSNYKKAQASYNGLRKQLQLLNISPANVEAGNITSIVSIYAPISGSITKVNVTMGTYVSPATPILEIIDNDHLHLELSIFEKDILKLKKGQPILFKIPESSQETYHADVHLIGTSIESNRTIKVHGHLENEEQVNFLTGMFVDADIVVESAFAKALPETAIAKIEEDSFVLLLHEKTDEGYYFEQIEVDTGDIFKKFIPIVGDELDRKALFLTKGAFNLIGESGGHDH